MDWSGPDGWTVKSSFNIEKMRNDEKPITDFNIYEGLGSAYTLGLAIDQERPEWLERYDTLLEYGHK